MTTTNFTNIELPGREPLFTGKGWTAFLVALVFVCLCVPLMNLVVPQGHWLHFSDYAVSLIGKIMCYAICALAMDLIWGYTGILSLGHGLFFAIGGYAMGMYLMRQIGTDGNYNLTFVDGAMVINKAALTATGNSASVTYNGANQTVSGFTVSGLQGTDTVSSLSSISATGATAKNAGSYANTVSAGTETNYTVTPVNGSLDIAKANATVTANGGTLTYNGVGFVQAVRQVAEHFRHIARTTR